MRIFFFSILIIFSLNSFSQIQNVNKYDDLIKLQNSLKSEFKIIVVWGHFGSWGKFGADSYKDICPGLVNHLDYKGLLSALNFKLFSDSATIYYLPIKKSAKILSDFKPDDIIKLKIKLYRNCKMLNDKPYFLIEEIL